MREKKPAKAPHCILTLSWLKQEPTFPLRQMECSARNPLPIGQRGSADCVVEKKDHTEGRRRIVRITSEGEGLPSW